MIKKTLCFSNPAYLSLKNSQLVIKLPEVERADMPDALKNASVRTIPIEDIGVVVLDNKQITVTTGVLEALLENNAAVITCDSKSMPVGLLLPLDGHTEQSERFRAQIDASLPLKKQLWQQTVEAKIRNQAISLQLSTGEPAKNMMAWSKQVKSDDSDNLEGRAAAYYWKNFFSDIPGFVRGREEMPPNNLLNYGYAILRAVVARALVSSGLLPTLGIHHRNKYNAYCLADDVMEPYRPFVDQLVLQTIKECDDFSQINKEIKMRLLRVPDIDVTIEGKRSPLMVGVSLTTSSLAKCYTGESRRIIYPEMNIK